MNTTYRLNANELTVQLVEMIRKSFPDKEIEITVMEQGMVEYLKSSASNEAQVNEAIRRTENGDNLVTVNPTKL